jgi:predicted methyltransferase
MQTQRMAHTASIALLERMPRDITMGDIDERVIEEIGCLIPCLSNYRW